MVKIGEEKAMEFKENQEDGLYRVEMSGDFVFSDNPGFRAILKKIEDDATVQRIIFQMEKLDFIDSAALGMLLLAHDAAAKKKAKLILRGASFLVKKIFALAHFQRLFVIE